MSNQEHKDQLTGQIEICLQHATNPNDYNICLVGTVDRDLCKSINLLLVNDRYIKLIPSDDYFNYLVNSTGSKIEF